MLVTTTLHFINITCVGHFMVNELFNNTLIPSIAIKLDRHYKYIAAAIFIDIIATVLVAAFATDFSTTYAILPNAVVLTAIIPILLLLTTSYNRLLLTGTNDC